MSVVMATGRQMAGAEEGGRLKCGGEMEFCVPGSVCNRGWLGTGTRNAGNCSRFVDSIEWSSG